MRGRLAAALLTALSSVNLFFPGPLSAQCTWNIRALAGIFGGTDGLIYSTHQAQVMSNPGCIHSRRIIVRSQMLRNGSPFAPPRDKVGGPAVLGAYVDDRWEAHACQDSWLATSLGGTTYLGINYWRDDDISGQLYASCPPPPPPCGGMYEDTSTWTLGPDGPRLADRQLGLALSRSEERPEGFYFFDEWAMLGVRETAINLRLSSTREFKERLGEVRDSYRPIPARARRVLVIEAGNHPHNSRHIPTPSFVPMAVDLGTLAEGSGQPLGGELWFRAELAPTGEVDKIIILESSVPVAEHSLHDAIRGKLAVRYETEKRHRVVVFGFGRVNAAGLLSVKDAVVVPPPCCCGGQICY